MNYHNILHDDMRNGEGLRVVLFVSGCDHHCNNCHNPQTWDKNSGIQFDLAAREEIFEQLDNDYICGITFSGGDPLFMNNTKEVSSLICEIKNKYPDKTIWVYTGYVWETIRAIICTHYLVPCKEAYWSIELNKIIKDIDVLVDGEFIQELADVNYPWAGSTNQRVIDVQKSLKSGEITLWENEY